MAGSRPAARTAQAKATQRTQPKAGRPAAAPAQPTYTGELAQFAAPGGFGAGAALRARAAGFSEEQIKAGVEQLRNQGMAIGKRVDIGLNPLEYGNDMAIRGAQEGGFTDAGSGQKYGMRAIYLPEDLKNVGGGLGVVWASGPGTDQQIIDMFRGKPRESWVLPPSTSAPDATYTAPAGVSYINPLTSAAEQARQAVAGLEIPQLFAQLTAAPTAATAGKAVKAKQLAKKAKQKTGRKARPKGMDLSKYYGAGALSVGRYGAGG